MVICSRCGVSSTWNRTTLKTFGCSKSFFPAPYPIFSIASGGMLPYSSTKALMKPAPVGVVNSPFTWKSAKGTPINISAVAGAGIG